jgi:hypothetical protein
MKTQRYKIYGCLLLTSAIAVLVCSVFFCTGGERVLTANQMNCIYGGGNPCEYCAPYGQDCEYAYSYGQSCSTTGGCYYGWVTSCRQGKMECQGPAQPSSECTSDTEPCQGYYDFFNCYEEGEYCASSAGRAYCDNDKGWCYSG